MYRKEHNPTNKASVPGHEIDSGWAVFKLPEEEGEEEQLVAVVDTETIADALIEMCEPAGAVAKLIEELRSHFSTQDSVIGSPKLYEAFTELYKSKH